MYTYISTKHYRMNPEGHKQRSSLLTTGVWEPWLSPSPLVGLHEGDVVSGRQGSFFKKPPGPSSDEHLSTFRLPVALELDVAVHGLRMR